MTPRTLYLGSQSSSRQELLTLAHIPFQVLPHNSDECVVDTGCSFEEYVLKIAKSKLDHLLMPSLNEIKDDEVFVLTADSLVKSCVTGDVLGKPLDAQDVHRMLRIVRQGPMDVITATCIEKRTKNGRDWKTVDKKYFAITTQVEYCVEDDMIDEYIRRLPGCIHSASSGIIEGEGLAFLKSVRGSYTNAMGLPLYEVRMALKDMGFFS